MAVVKVRGLSADELEKIRAAVDAGRKPKVMFTEAAGQIAGQLGQVVALTDPAASDEWVVVRFGRDELPFSPGDLRTPPRGATARKAVPAPAPAPEPPAPEFVIDKPVAPPARRTPPAPVNGQAVRMAPPAPAPRKSKAKPPPGLTVTLAYTEGEWTVAAAQGAKTLAKPYVVKPAEALRMVALVDVPGVREAVEQIVAAERAEAEQAVERLRAELAEVESRLAELRDAAG